MSHAGEAEAARAISFDQMPAGDEALGTRRIRAHTFALAIACASVSFSVGLSSVSARTPR